MLVFGELQQLFLLAWIQLQEQLFASNILKMKIRRSNKTEVSDYMKYTHSND